MRYALPIPVPAPLAPCDAPALRGAVPLRLAGGFRLGRDAGAVRLSAAEAIADAPVLATVPPPLCGLTLDRPRIMGILNVTPDSFSDGGRFDAPQAAFDQAQRMVEQGAEILDIGGESTRPGATEVPEADEIARTAPVIEALRAAGLKVPISIDTRKARVAEAALHAGADMVNDVSGLTWDARLAGVVADARVPICLMHAQGTPQTMQANPQYDDVRLDVFDWLMAAIRRAEAAGIDPARIVVDPGIGFGKTQAHNLALLQHLALFHATGCPILLGASRKRFVGAISGVAVAGDRVAGSVAVALHAAGQGAQILRVHDVDETRQALALWLALNCTERAMA